jgi:hypothetical protein
MNFSLPLIKTIKGNMPRVRLAGINVCQCCNANLGKIHITTTTYYGNSSLVQFIMDVSISKLLHELATVPYRCLFDQQLPGACRLLLLHDTVPEGEQP